ncbi:MAG: hypothetical protein K5849_01575 [Bacteroidales bacterium]|nr:hypothetical protein [Bacteroidales bacterium]
MHKALRLLLPLVLLHLCQVLPGQERLLGLYQSPRGVGISAVIETEDGLEMNILTVRTDFYGVLSGRTQDVGACVSYTHDYVLYQLNGEDYFLRFHIGAGGLFGFTHDFEKGFFSKYERQLERKPGWTGALDCNVGLRIDFRRRLSLDFSLSALPGIHIRTDNRTGALLVNFYRAGIYNAYYPQVNLMYRF